MFYNIFIKYYCNKYYNEKLLYNLKLAYYGIKMANEKLSLGSDNQCHSHLKGTYLNYYRKEAELELKYSSNLSLYDYIEKRMNIIKEGESGNCQENSEIAFLELYKYNPNIYIGSFYQNLVIKIKDLDHSVTIIDPSSYINYVIGNNSTVICDPWKNFYCPYSELSYCYKKLFNWNKFKLYYDYDDLFTQKDMIKNSNEMNNSNNRNNMNMNEVNKIILNKAENDRIENLYHQYLIKSAEINYYKILLVINLFIIFFDYIFILSLIYFLIKYFIARKAKSEIWLKDYYFDSNYCKNCKLIPLSST